MPKKRYTSEEVVAKSRQVDGPLSSGRARDEPFIHTFNGYRGVSRLVLGDDRAKSMAFIHPARRDVWQRMPAPFLSRRVGHDRLQEAFPGIE